jgi:hypothetical protein
VNQLIQFLSQKKGHRHNETHQDLVRTGLDKASEFVDSSVGAYPEAIAEEYEYKMVGKLIV